MDTPTYACTLTPGDAADRAADDRALAARVRETRRLEHGLLVTVAGGDESRRLVDRFVANESRCCGFFDFAVDERADLVTLEITAPPAEDAQALLDMAHDTFARALPERDDG